jgi:hypothetical protein
MSQILKEYLILIILAALAIIGLIWYTRRNAADAIEGVTKIAKSYSADVGTIAGAATPSGISDLLGSLFKPTKYISQEDQRKALADINAKLFKK